MFWDRLGCFCIAPSLEVARANSAHEISLDGLALGWACILDSCTTLYTCLAGCLDSLCEAFQTLHVVSDQCVFEQQCRTTTRKFDDGGRVRRGHLGEVSIVMTHFSVKSVCSHSLCTVLASS